MEIQNNNSLEGKENLENAEIKVDTDTILEQEKPKSSKKKILMILTIVLLSILSLASLIYYFFLYNRDDKLVETEEERETEEIAKEKQSKEEIPIGLDFSIWFHNDNYLGPGGIYYFPEEANITLYRFKNDNIEKINILMEDFETGGGVLSSDGEYTAFLYWDKEKDYFGESDGNRFKFGESFRKGIAYINNTNPQEAVILKENGNYTHKYLEWSPGNKYISYFGKGEGNSGIIEVKTGKEIKVLNSEVLVTWIDADTYSFIDAGKLYLYSISQQKETLVTDSVLKSYRRFEAQPIYQKPYWSPDGKFVVYSEGDEGWEKEAVLFDIENQKKYYFGDVLTEIDKEILVYRFSDINTKFVGWDGKNNFFYYSYGASSWENMEHGESEDPILRSIKLINGEKIIEDWFTIGRRGSRLTQLKIHPFLYFDGIIYDIESKEEKCALKNLNEEELWEEVKAYKNYLFLYYPANNSTNTLKIYNVNTCEYVSSVNIEERIHDITIVD